MSVGLPRASLTFGTVTPPEQDIKELKVHLGATKEVSNFTCLLHNFDKKYSPGGTSPIILGSDGSINMGRESNIPQLISCRVESINCRSVPMENEILIEGRCFGEKLFRKLVTKKYVNQKGEAIVKDLIDNYVNLSHIRDSTELIEDTDTTFSLIEYENSPVWDILKYIAEASDKAGVIGFEFRVAPDGKFEFFPRNSKTSPVSLTETFMLGEYERSILRKRDKIFVYGAADKKYPADESWTETLDINGDTVNDWKSGTGTGSVSLDFIKKAAGTCSIKHTTNLNDYYANLRLDIPSALRPNLNDYPTFHFQIYRERQFSGECSLRLTDNAGKQVTRDFNIPADKWIKEKFVGGEKYADEWKGDSSVFNWAVITTIEWFVEFPGVGMGCFWVDDLYFDSKRWSATYGTGERELSETDEELHSDNECLLRAKALYDHLGGTAEYIKVSSEILDYGNNPLLPGDKIWVTLPNENVDGYYRIINAEYFFSEENQTLTVSLDLGKEPPLLADYLYGLRSTTVNVEKLARTKIGKSFVGSFSGGGAGRIEELTKSLASAKKTGVAPGTETTVASYSVGEGTTVRLDGFVVWGTCPAVFRLYAGTSLKASGMTSAAKPIASVKLREHVSGPTTIYLKTLHYTPAAGVDDYHDFEGTILGE